MQEASVQLDHGRDYVLLDLMINRHVSATEKADLRCPRHTLFYIYLLFDFICREDSTRSIFALWVGTVKQSRVVVLDSRL